MLSTKTSTNGRYDHKITDTFFWYAGVGWDRNRPAGIENRYTDLFDTVGGTQVGTVSSKRTSSIRSSRPRSS